MCLCVWLVHRGHQDQQNGVGCAPAVRPVVMLVLDVRNQSSPVSLPCDWPQRNRIQTVASHVLSNTPQIRTQTHNIHTHTELQEPCTQLQLPIISQILENKQILISDTHSTLKCVHRSLSYERAAIPSPGSLKELHLVTPDPTVVQSYT